MNEIFFCFFEIRRMGWILHLMEIWLKNELVLLHKNNSDKKRQFYLKEQFLTLKDLELKIH